MNKKDCCRKEKCVNPNGYKDIPLNLFNKLTKSSDGLKGYCKFCHKSDNDASNPRHNQSNEKYPAPDKAIYGIFDGEMLVYIGESKRTTKRLYQHLSGVNAGSKMFHNGELSKEELTEFSYKILWDGTDFDKQERLFREAVLIQALKPKYNKQWKQDE